MFDWFHPLIIYLFEREGMIIIKFDSQVLSITPWHFYQGKAYYLFGVYVLESIFVAGSE